MQHPTTTLCTVHIVHYALYNVVVGWCEQHQAARESASGIGDKHSRVGFFHSSSPIDIKAGWQWWSSHPCGKQWWWRLDSGCRSLWISPKPRFSKRNTLPAAINIQYWSVNIVEIGVKWMSFHKCRFNFSVSIILNNPQQFVDRSGLSSGADATNTARTNDTNRNGS